MDAARGNFLRPVLKPWIALPTYDESIANEVGTVSDHSVQPQTCLFSSLRWRGFQPRRSYANRWIDLQLSGRFIVKSTIKKTLSVISETTPS